MFQLLPGLCVCYHAGSQVHWRWNSLMRASACHGQHALKLEGVRLGPVSELMFMFGFSFSDVEDEFTQLRRIGDKLNFWQKLLNFFSKLFNSVTWVHQKFLQAGTPKKEGSPSWCRCLLWDGQWCDGGDASLSTDREWHGNEFLQERFQKPFFELW